MEEGKEKQGCKCESSLAVCDNVVDYQMQRTSFAFQSAVCNVNISVCLCLSASRSLTHVPLFLCLALGVLSLCALKFNLRMNGLAAASLTCIMRLSNIAHTPRCTTKLANCKYLYGLK